MEESMWDGIGTGKYLWEEGLSYCSSIDMPHRMRLISEINSSMDWYHREQLSYADFWNIASGGWEDLQNPTVV